MKKIIFIITAMMLSLTSANAQTISIGDITMRSGETKVVSINLENTQSNIVAFQMDLTLPDGVTINKAECALGNRITDADQKLVIGKQPDGSIRLTSTSFVLTPIAGTSGELVKLSLTAANDAKGGTASLGNIKLATDDSQRLTPENSSFKIGIAYTLTYLVDGEEYKSTTVKYGDAITPIDEPTKEGYTFSGWSEIPATMPAKDVTIEGSFSINSYKLTYLVDGEEYKTTEVEYGSPITPEQEPTMEGFIFSGWSEIPETMPAKDVTIEGSFTPDTTGLDGINAADGVKPNGKYLEKGKIVIWQDGTKFTTSGTIAR